MKSADKELIGNHQITSAQKRVSGLPNSSRFDWVTQYCISDPVNYLSGDGQTC